MVCITLFLLFGVPICLAIMRATASDEDTEGDDHYHHHDETMPDNNAKKEKESKLKKRPKHAE